MSKNGGPANLYQPVYHETSFCSILGSAGASEESTSADTQSHKFYEQD